MFFTLKSQIFLTMAVSLGGDADTQGAIAGGIASAVCEVPEEILSECLERLDPQLTDVIDRFNEVCDENNRFIGKDWSIIASTRIRVSQPTVWFSETTTFLSVK